MRNLFLTIFVTLIFGMTTATAQVFIQNTQFMFNRVVYNPGAVGSAGGTNITMLGRAQWAGIEGSPNLASISADGPVDAIRGGVGGYILADKLGPLSTIGANVAYAFHLDLADKEASESGSVPTLNIGVQGGILQKSLNGTFDYPVSVFGLDPIIPAGDYAASVIVPSLGAGIYVNGPDGKYYAGVSGLDLLEPSIEGLLQAEVGDDSRVSRSFYFMGGYRFEFGDDNRFRLEPGVLARTDGSSFQFDMNLNFSFRPILFGISHRWNDSVSGILGFSVSDRFYLGYSYDYTYSRLNVNRDIHSHELVLSYSFSGSNRVPPPIRDTEGRFNNGL